MGKLQLRYIFFWFDFFSFFKKKCAQLYSAGKFRSLGTFHSWEQAVVAHKFAREQLKPEPVLRPFDAETNKQMERTV